MGKRAVSVEQKQERRKVIIGVAKRLFTEKKFADISMREIAEEAKLAKGTIFLYFKTKEELFLAYAREEISSWSEIFEVELNKLKEKPQTITIDNIIAIIDKTLTNNLSLRRIFAIMDETLEQNIDYNTAREFKHFLKAMCSRAGCILEECLGFLKPGDGEKVFFYIFILIVGVQHVSDPSPVIKEVIEDPELNMFKVDFRDTFTQMFKYLIEGMKKEH